MIAVDEHQFQLGYAPIACGIQILVGLCGLSSIALVIWWLVNRGGG
ncbi:MAG: hypothetical protein AAF629_19730 [Chloroflexota bacterium]